LIIPDVAVVDGFATCDVVGVAAMVGVGEGRLMVCVGLGVAVGVDVCRAVHPVMSMMNDKIAMEAISGLNMLVDVWP
jgi:hypothetical protein